MNARIEKKLSKRIVELLPYYFRHSWIDVEYSEQAEDEKNCVSHVPSLGGGTNVWGEGEDFTTTWQDFRRNYVWICNSPIYPDGHFLEGYPDTENFYPTTQNLLNLA